MTSLPIIQLVLAFAFLGLNTGCSSGNKSSPQVNSSSTITDVDNSPCGDSKVSGTWVRDGIEGIETLELSDSICSGYSDYCGSHMAYSATRETSETWGSTGSMTFTITDAAVSLRDKCLPNGTYNNCHYSVRDSSLTILCNETHNMSFQKGL